MCKMADIGDVIGMVIGIVITALLVPMGIQAIADTAVEDWDATLVTLWQTLLPLMIIIGIILGYVPKFKNE